VSVEVSRKHLVLVGLMGVGKTTVGSVLARRLGRQLVDSDQRIETLTGCTVRQILADDGVDTLRRHEAEALFDALDDTEPRVIAAAAGVVLDPVNVQRLRHAADAGTAEVVWLDIDPNLLAPRAATRQHRPWLEDDPVGTLLRMHAEREHLYRGVADRVVAVDGLTADEVADRILG
jgi:shikimate kinase